MTAEVKRNPDYTAERIKLPTPDLTFQHVDESASDKKDIFPQNLHGSLGTYIIEKV